MSMPFQPIPCTRCGQPVQPDPQAHGMWVDRWNGRYCGGDQRFPHQVPNAAGPLPPHQAPNAAAPFPTPPVPHAAPAKRTTAVWVVAGSALAVIVLIAVVAGVFLLRPGPGKPTAAGTSERSPQPVESSAVPRQQESQLPQSRQTEAEQTAPPYAPVPCDPKRPFGHRCFPPSTTGAEFLERIRKAENWICYRKGEKNRAGYETSRAECEAFNNKDRPYTLKASIGYDTDILQDDGPMQKVVISASTSGKNGGATVKETADFAVRVFDIALTHLWPDNEQLRTEAKQAFEKVHALCAKDVRPEDPVQMPSGYVVSCDPPVAIIINDAKGVPVTTRSYIIHLRAPYVYEVSNTD
ncbi:hypothetical protein [Thermostaphylospora chromogena]|uniref:Uncharacterized protein n=1 Tax=Thermostaphylospora chromogena TaxID=35622 RepID=A0A1H1D2H7_9ACTN|nr:hypothetical protein [Thermostaphylospora chromogena]SDQ70630.1 hypothetical protein SAMN04489764_1786 [Thermostaphylospora chromogena]